jgi:type VI protein secretion system component VasF
MVSAGSLLARRSPSRAAIYAHMVADPSREWSIGELHQELADAGVSAESARAVVYLLLDARIVELVRGRRRLTVKLAACAADHLRQVIGHWSSAQADRAAS